MGRLYHTLRQLLTIGLDLYFVDIQAQGLSEVPASGPVIFAANHPNSIMDTILLGTRTPRQIHYMARSGLFANPLASLLFYKVGVIPLYRSQDQGGAGAHNTHSFEAAFEVLERGQCVGIFPEGQNSEERRVLPIKTGTARIALGAEARAAFRLGVKIVPVGINFQDRDQFLSAVLLRFGEPIDARAWSARWREDEREAVRDLTETIERGIRSQTVHVAHELTLSLAQDLVAISDGALIEALVEQTERDGAIYLPGGVPREQRGLRRELLDEVRSVPRAPKMSLAMDLEQIMANAIERRSGTSAALIEELRRDVIRYKEHLAQVRLRHDFARRHPATLSSRREALKMTAYAVCYGPVAFWGLAHNILPYQLTKVIARRASSEAIRAMTAFGAGIVIFSLWYALLGWAVWHGGQVTRWWWLVMYLVSLGPAGFFFLRWRAMVAKWRARILSRTLFRTNRNLMHGLMRERERIIERARGLLDDHLQDALPLDHEQAHDPADEP